MTSRSASRRWPARSPSFPSSGRPASSPTARSRPRSSSARSSRSSTRAPASATSTLENPTDLSLLVYEGEEVLGAQQNRSFDSSVLVAAGARVQVPVSCVEHGRWDSRRHGERFAPSPQAADPELRRTKRHAVNLRAAAGAAPRADQGEVWREVGSRLQRHGVDSASDAMSDLYEHRRRNIGRLADVVRPLPGQLGARRPGRRPSGRARPREPSRRLRRSPSAPCPGVRAGGARGAGRRSRRAERIRLRRRGAPRAPGAPAHARAWDTPSASSPPAWSAAGSPPSDELVQLCAFPEERAPEGRIARPARRRRLR